MDPTQSSANNEDQPAENPDSFEAKMKLEIREIGIPPRPAILIQIEEESAKDEPDFIYMAKLLNRDVALAAGMIKVANAPYFSFGKKVPTVQEALLVLGLKLVTKTVSGLALQQVFKHVPHMDRFWDTSAMTADVSGCVAKQLGRDIGIRPEDAYTFALFRDCGIPMLMNPFPEYREVLARANNESVLSFTAVEEASIGLNHAVLGAQLAESWLLPDETCQAIRHHHDREALNGTIAIPERSRRLIAVAQLAEYLIQLKTAQSRSHEWAKLGSDCLACLGLTSDDLPDLSAQCTSG